ncbi:hypothetical protein BXZ70DRAFT_152911 [Cristinia sonorae]|uniref:HIT domain-containing protein n=1 Tax=Cristinia sonorae TaxID=1940300 RepID=A0A8K0UMT5_9AGAR|nr:hypothetical protein BXZ70DRAFT_152911 [Cristinia sonorae]
MAFAPRSGCPMCSIVASAAHTPAHSPRSPNFPIGSKQPEVLWRDDNFTIYRERANPVSSKGHLVIVFNLHVPSLYTLSTSDVPLLVSLRDLSRRLLNSLLPLPSSSVPASPAAFHDELHITTPTSANHFLPPRRLEPSHADVANDSFRIGFITPPFKDNKIPVTDHLHAHAYIMPADLMGWWRRVGYSAMAWYSIDDLIAEIREDSSNNRVRSGNPTQRHLRPIDTVPSAGARTGTPNGIETTDKGIATVDVEDPESRLHRRTNSNGSVQGFFRSHSPSPLLGQRSPTSSLYETAPFVGSGGGIVMDPRVDGRKSPRPTPPNISVPHVQVSLAEV